MLARDSATRCTVQAFTNLSDDIPLYESAEAPLSWVMPAGKRLNDLRKVEFKLPGKGKLNVYDARPLNQIVSTIKWIRTGRLSIKNSLFGTRIEDPHLIPWS